MVLQREASAVDAGCGRARVCVCVWLAHFLALLPSLASRGDERGLQLLGGQAA